MQILDIRKFGLLLVLLFCSALIIVSCGDDGDDPEECTTTGLTYENYAENFINSNCVNSGCHDADAVESVGNFETYESLTMSTSFDKIKGAINHQDGFSNMPKGGAQLDSCSIAKLSAWIDAGAPEN